MRGFLMKITGYSRQQLTRLIRKYNTTSHIYHRQCRSNGFTKTYTKKDVVLLVEIDKRHNNLCGHATKKRFERAYKLEFNPLYENLSTVSVSQIYNMRHLHIRIHVDHSFASMLITFFIKI